MPSSVPSLGATAHAFSAEHRGAPAVASVRSPRPPAGRRRDRRTAAAGASARELRDDARGQPAATVGPRAAQRRRPVGGTEPGGRGPAGSRDQAHCPRPAAPAGTGRFDLLRLRTQGLESPNSPGRGSPPVPAHLAPRPRHPDYPADHPGRPNGDDGRQHPAGAGPVPGPGCGPGWGPGNVGRSLRIPRDVAHARFLSRGPTVRSYEFRVHDGAPLRGPTVLQSARTVIPPLV
jgi:hypothetical protein